MSQTKWKSGKEYQGEIQLGPFGTRYVQLVRDDLHRCGAFYWTNSNTVALCTKPNDGHRKHGKADEL